jgi:hypothetical protein
MNKKCVASWNLLNNLLDDTYGNLEHQHAQIDYIIGWPILISKNVVIDKIKYHDLEIITAKCPTDIDM